jgi:ABC-type polysaccharide/polyol phosphate export permease
VAVSGILFVAVGIMAWPDNYPLMLVGFLYTTWWSLCVAMILACLSERFELVVHIWSPISYLYIFYSGFLILADWLPERLRDTMLLIDPPLHCYEMIRGGMFGPRLMHPHYDIAYLTFFLTALTAIGLWLMRNVRQHLELE